MTARSYNPSRQMLHGFLFGLALSACATSSATAPPAAETGDELPAGPPPRLSDDEIRQARLDAQTVAAVWLRQVDQGDHGGSWETAASHLQNRVGKGEWTQGLGSARSAFGNVQRRHFVKTRYTNKLQPAGHHVMVNYHSLFEGSPARESVTVMKDADNQWRVIMYGIEKTDKAPPEETPPPEADEDDDDTE